MARALGVDLPISTKVSIEICNKIRNMKLERAITDLEKVTEKKMPIKFTRFNGDTGHKPGIGPGKYPIKACKEIIKMLKSVQSNAGSKGLDVNSLFIKHVCAQKASKTLHYGRRYGREMKRTHIEVVVAERVEKKKEKVQKKATKEVKKEEKKRKN